MNVASINKQALAQTYYIIDSFDESIRINVPNNLMNTIQENMDKHYKDTSVLMEETKEILYAIINKYVLNQSEKEKLSEYYKYSDAKLEEEKSKSFKQKEIFKNHKDAIKENVDCVSMTTYKDNIFRRIIRKIKSWFKR